jgi:hypothetical protein
MLTGIKENSVGTLLWSAYNVGFDVLMVAMKRCGG